MAKFEDDMILLGCCGAYCRTCRVMVDGVCAGCKTGYADKSRELSRAGCKMKVCCITNGLTSCADCTSFDTCEALNSFYAKKGYKYKKYREDLIFIREKGYVDFFRIANKWKMQYGKL